MKRSLLFVPAVEEKLNKIRDLGADCVIIDLEDSVSAGDKDAALERVCRFLDGDPSAKPLFVRLNAGRYRLEAEKLRDRDAGFVLPKFEDPDDYAECVQVWKSHPVIALIETPKGIVNAGKTAACGWVDALGFGAEDYTAAAGMENRPDLLQYQKSMLVTYAKAYSKQVYDTPSFSIDDESVFKYEVDNAAALGFDGKMLIHPKHIEYINKAFGSPDPERLREIVRQYEAAGEAVVVIDGKVYEKMHIRRIKRILAGNLESI